MIESLGGYRKSKKYTSADIQNEILEIMWLKILHDMVTQIRNATFYSIMGDEYTDISNKEQFLSVFDG